MPSPFPGMDPYIETSGRWGDFHLNMLSAMRGQLNARLPRGYVAETEQYVWVHEPSGSSRPRRLEPDIYVSGSESAGATGAGGTAVADPETLVMASTQRRKHRYLRVRDRASNRLVAVVELLSPSNKFAGEDREAYLAKRREYLGGGVNLVEIDLLRGGPRLPLSHPPPKFADYYAAVFRSWLFPRFGFWSFALRDPLPEVPVPLAADVREVTLPLRPCVDRVYDEGRYGSLLPYGRPLTPRLRRADVAWVREVLSHRSSDGER